MGATEAISGGPQFLSRVVNEGIVPISETRRGEIGTPAAYGIQNGHIVATLGRTPLEMAVVKSGDKYVAARSNEFGYANYEIVPAPDRRGPRSDGAGAWPEVSCPMLTKMRREPLAHFLLIGLAMFAVYDVANPATNLAGSPRRIEVNSVRFVRPGRTNFRHLYFSFNRRRDHARDDATRALSAAAGKQSDLSATAASAESR